MFRLKRPASNCLRIWVENISRFLVYLMSIKKQVVVFVNNTVKKKGGGSANPHERRHSGGLFQTGKTQKFTGRKSLKNVTTTTWEDDVLKLIYKRMSCIWPVERYSDIVWSTKWSNVHASTFIEKDQNITNLAVFAKVYNRWEIWRWSVIKVNIHWSRVSEQFKVQALSWLNHRP